MLRICCASDIDMDDVGGQSAIQSLTIGSSNHRVSAILTVGAYLGGHNDVARTGPEEGVWASSAYQFFRCTSACCNGQPLALASRGGSIFETGTVFQKHAGESQAGSRVSVAFLCTHDWSWGFCLVAVAQGFMPGLWRT